MLEVVEEFQNAMQLVELVLKFQNAMQLVALSCRDLDHKMRS